MTATDLLKPCKVKTEIDIPFYDVDQMHIVWHGNYLKYFEVSRCELLATFDYGYRQMKASGYGWPVIDTRLKFVRPAIFEQRIVVESELVEFANRLKINYVVRDKSEQTVLTKGHTIQVAVELDSGEMCYVSPDILESQLAKHGYR